MRAESTRDGRYHRSGACSMRIFPGISRA